MTPIGNTFSKPRKRKTGDTPRDGGLIHNFSRGSLTKSAAKGYALIWVLDLQMGSHDLLLGRQRRPGQQGELRRGGSP